MSLEQLDIHHLRLITSARLTFHPRYNIFYGDNGSGKTSALEAIYLLGHGLSFRTRDINALIQQGETAFTLFSRTIHQDSLSLQKTKAAMRVRLNQSDCLRRSELAHFLPCQVFYQDMFNIMDAGPSVRRNVLDWGLFHVKHEYHLLWKNYHRVLKQRNALLRQKAARLDCLPWDTQLVELSEALHELRLSYCKDWFSVFDSVLAQLTENRCTLRYEKGWDKKNTGKSLSQILEEQFELDKTHQYTHAGAHHADIGFYVDTSKAKPILSRGQQKIILMALKLSQTQWLDKTCLYLFDDITTELDHNHIDRFLAYLTTIKGQFFFTSIDPSLFRLKLGQQPAAFFEIQQGVINRFLEKAMD